MKLTRTWIDRQLSRKQRQLLVDWLLERSQNPTGEQILEALAELFPELESELPSLVSVLGWRNQVWAFELHQRSLREDSRAAKLLAEAGDGSDLDEANRVMLQSMIFAMLRDVKEGRMEDVDPDLLAKLAKNTAILARQGQTERELEARLQRQHLELIEIKRRATELTKTAEDDNLTPAERLRRIREGLKLS